MERLYLAATEPNSGKTVLALGLGLRTVRDGIAFRYSNPSDGGESDGAQLAREVLGAPAVIDAATVSDGQESDGADGFVLIEGQRRGNGADLRSDAEAAASLDARVIAVVWHSEELTAEDVSQAAEPFGDRLAGVVLNGVPRLRMHAVETGLIPMVEASGVRVLGLLPQNRLLSSPTFGELVAFLGAEVVAFPEGLDEPAENVMLGALALDGGIHYYGGTARKVVITRWDRPDLQMPALETGCQGLILTNGGRPIPYVWDRVQQLRVPVALVQSGTVATANHLGAGFLARRGRPSRRKAEHVADCLAALAPGLVELVQSRSPS